MELHPKPKQSVQINRPLIITAGIVVITVLLLAIIVALTTSNRIKTSGAPSVVKSVSDKIAISPELSGLPGDYSDVEGIKKYSPDSAGKQLDFLNKKFNALLEEYEYLRQELASKKREPEKAPEDPRLQEVKKIGIVFAGLGSKAESMVEDGRARPTPETKETPTATGQQEEAYRKQTFNDHRLAVMKGKDEAEKFYNLHSPVYPISDKRAKLKALTKHLIQAGTLIPANLVTGIDSTLNGTIIAQVRTDMYDSISGKFLLIPKGSKILGDYVASVRTGQRRMLLVFNRIIRPDGSSILIEKTTGADNAGKSGVEGSVDNHWGAIIGGAAISSILSAASSMAGDRFNTGGNYPGARERAFSGLSGGVSQFGQRIVDRTLDIAPTINIPPGYPFDLVVNKDIVLDRYQPRTYS